MEDKGNFISRLFKGRKKAPVTEAVSPPPEQPVQKVVPMPGAEERKDIQKARNLKQAQDTYAQQIRDVQTGNISKSPRGNNPEEIKEKSEEAATTQTLNEAARVQNKLAPKGTASERFSRLTQNPPKPDLPIYPVQQTPTENITPPIQTSTQTPSQEDVKTTLFKQRIGKLDKGALSKSLDTPRSEWGRETKPTTPQKPVNKNESVAPFPAGTFPGVDKWKPGKGAIDRDTAEEIRKEVKEMPENSFEETAPEVEQKKSISTPTVTPTLPPQEKGKEVA
ncbi:hypothetical protein DRH13_00330 [Candidatus Woesebacteria bacterium]|nr:MAG: hypothetical protein DRH13_00330 [Candidatus Woesebacteria bacterium]